MVFTSEGNDDGECEATSGNYGSFRFEGNINDGLMVIGKDGSLWKCKVTRKEVTSMGRGCGYRF